MRKRIITWLIISVVFILALPILFIGVCELLGIGKKEEGLKVYEAFSPLIERKNIIAKYKIKCIAEDVESVAFIDISRGKTFFVYNVNQDNYYFYEKIRYNKVPKEIVNKYQFVVHFSWIEIYGKYIYYGISVFIIVIFAGSWWLTRK